jgi:tetratricopeptide (TPR) repeat protein
VRTAVYETLAAESRRVWHRRIAHALEELHTGHDAIAGDIARHFELGGDVLPALPYFVRAARHAEALSAADEALALLAHAQTFPMPRELRAEAILLAETIHRRIGNRAAQQADIEALEELAGDDEQLRAEALYRRILWARSLGLRDDERAYIEALERSAPEAGGDGWRGRVLACKSEHFALINDFTEAEAAARAALGVHQALGDVEAQVADLCLLVAVATQRGNHDVAGEHLAEAQRLAETQRNPRLVADTLFAASGSALTLHDLTAAIDLARTAGERYAALGDRESQADALARIATALARLGRHDEARAHNVDAAAIFEAIGKRQGLAVAVLNLGLISCRMGVLGRAIAEFERAAQLFRSIHDTRGQTVCAINLACLRLRRGETLEAKADAQLALEFARRMKHTVYEAEALANLGAAERDLGELDAAIEHMQLGLSRQLETGRVSDRANDLADLALAYHLHGDSAAACSAVDEVLASAQSASDLSLWPQNLYWIAAQVYRGAGRDEAWPELLATAYRIMLERGSVLTDADERNEFFALPLNREIEDAHVGRRWPQTPS